MASCEHIKWLMEGVETWNAKRRELRFRPDLAGADLRCADLTDANLQCADLTDAVITKKTLLRGARLEGAILTHSRIWQAELWEKLPGGQEKWTHVAQDRKESICGINDFITKFDKLRKNYRPEDEVEFYFRGERKYFCNLAPSVMRREGPDGDLRGVEGDMLVRLRSRRAEDFDGATSALDEMVIARHHGLPTRLLDVTHNPLVALFNACEDEDQQSDTEGGRANRSDGQKPESDGRIHIFAVPRFLIKPFNSDTVSVIANLARLGPGEQNLLLGKTRDDPPLIYGSELPSDVSYGDVMNRLYQFIRLEKPSFAARIRPQDLYRVYVVEPKQSFERIRAQSGAFLISAFHEKFEERSIRDWCRRIPLYHHFTWRIPGSSKVTLRKHLDMFNITHETMLPGLDASAGETRRRYSRQQLLDN